MSATSRYRLIVPYHVREYPSSESLRQIRAEVAVTEVRNAITQETNGLVKPQTPTDAPKSSIDTQQSSS
jgi:hypothetical protein